MRLRNSARLDYRVSILESKIQPRPPVEPVPASMTYDEFFLRFQEIQRRAEQGEPNAFFRMESINRFIETALRRQREGLTPEEDMLQRAGIGRRQ
jgi:hypothetical protein